MPKHDVIDPNDFQLTVEPVPDHLTHLSPREMLEAMTHDCPECRAARARGEEPVFTEPPRRDVIRDRRPRWRKLKRVARR